MIRPAVMVDDETDAYELARRVAASDVSAETLTQLELAFDDLATSYAATPPAELLPRVRRHLAYIGQLVEARKTLSQHRRLLVVGGWLSRAWLRRISARNYAPVIVRAHSGDPPKWS